MVLDIKRYRIAFLSEHASPISSLGGEDAGGQNVYVREVTRRLAEQGYLVDIFTRPADPNAPMVLEWRPGIRVMNLAVGPHRFLPKDELWPLMPDFRDTILRFIQRSGIRYDLIHSNFWMSGWVAVELRRRLGIPVAHIFHALGLTKRRHQGEADTSPNGRVEVEKKIIRDVDRIIAQCPAEVAELADLYGADPARMVVIPPGVDGERFRPLPQAEARHRLELDPDEAIVVYVGRMVRRKGVRNIVRALGLLARQNGNGRGPRPPFRLMVVGGESATPDPERTPEIGALQQLAADLGVSEAIHFAGARPQNELYRYYSAGDVVVTTPWYEPFGLTPLEAMACGRPVIGAAVGGITYTVKDGLTGRLVPPREPEALAKALAELLADDEARQAMGRAARQRAMTEFTWAACARRTAALYQSLIQIRRPDRRPLRLPVTRRGPRPAAEVHGTD
jgi:glycosyltransferase involved in cell wall biosynthesis